MFCKEQLKAYMNRMRNCKFLVKILQYFKGFLSKFFLNVKNVKCILCTKTKPNNFIKPDFSHF